MISFIIMSYLISRWSVASVIVIIAVCAVVASLFLNRHDKRRHNLHIFCENLYYNLIE